MNRQSVDRNVPSRLSRLVSLAIFLFIGLSSSQATTLLVANNGTDSPTCGVPGNPCRSISRAIQNAGAGNTIIVGPGVYGDLNRNGDFTDAGDESAEIGTGCNCIVKVDKPLTILSRDGATVTIIDAGGNTADVVTILADGVTFGKLKKGFTLLDAGGNGLTISNGVGRVSVVGNRSMGNTQDGFLSADGTSSNLFSGNIAVNDGQDGFGLLGDNHTLKGNAATANGGSGFNVSGTNVVLTGNVASDNSLDGVEVSASTHSVTITHNALLSNERFGLLIAINKSATVTFNNIFGNNMVPVDVFGQTNVTNVGLANITGTNHPPLGAPDNFFGAATGPGADPADDVGDFNGSKTATGPVATKEIKVKPILP